MVVVIKNFFFIVTIFFSMTSISEDIWKLNENENKSQSSISQKTLDSQIIPT
jgi:hypothetical protein